MSCGDYIMAQFFVNKKYVKYFDRHFLSEAIYISE